MANLVHQDSTEGYKFNNFRIKFSNSSSKHYIETLKEDIKLVVMGKPGFENREDSILKKTSRLFWTIRTQLQVTERIIISANTPQKRKLLACDLGGRHDACGCGQR